MSEPENASMSPDMPRNAIGRIVSVNGSQAIVMLSQASPGSHQVKLNRTDMGTLLRIDTPFSMVLGLVSAQSVPAPSPGSDGTEIRIVELDLVGELIKDEAGVAKTFQRGVSHHPSLGDLVFPMTSALLTKAYSSNRNSIQIGSIIQDEKIPATVLIDELLAKHFAVLGTTGTGKSCAVALILNSILDVSPNAHILLIDPHNEYASAFGAKAEVITLENLDLPYWLFTFKEISAVIFGSATDVEEEVDILAELIPVVKARYASNKRRVSDVSVRRSDSQESPIYSVDTPTPYRISDLLDIIEQRMGSLELQHALLPYKRLKSRISAVSVDPRYAFMFGRAAAQDQMAAVLGRLFRIPVDSKPIAIAELTGLPSETVNVLVSVICRLAFDFARRSGGKVPITIVCEEAHRYIPNDPLLGFEPTRRAIARIAKEGRKYGISLCVISQRPGDLDPTILSQCNTIFALRLANEHDQKIVASAVSDTTGSLLDFLPTLGEREVIAFGDGVSLPMRFKFSELPPHALPKGRTARFTNQWKDHREDHSFVEAVVKRWRNSFSGETDHELEPQDEPHADTQTAMAAELPKATAEQPTLTGQPLSQVIAPETAQFDVPTAGPRQGFGEREFATAAINQPSPQAPSRQAPAQHPSPQRPPSTRHDTPAMAQQPSNSPPTGNSPAGNPTISDRAKLAEALARRMAQRDGVQQNQMPPQAISPPADPFETEPAHMPAPHEPPR